MAAFPFETYYKQEDSEAFSITEGKTLLGQPEGSVGKDDFCQAWRPKFNPQGPTWWKERLYTTVMSYDLHIWYALWCVPLTRKAEVGSLQLDFQTQSGLSKSILSQERWAKVCAMPCKPETCWTLETYRMHAHTPSQTHRHIQTSSSSFSSSSFLDRISFCSLDLAWNLWWNLGWPQSCNPPDLASQVLGL